MDIYFVIGLTGMMLILVAFLLNQMNIWKKDELIYDATNALGSLALIIYAYDGEAWPFVILNTVWFLYSMHDIIIDLRRK